MAVTHDAASNPAKATSATSLTFAHTCSGTERVLVVGSSVDDLVPADTTATYAGVSMTGIGALTNNFDRSELFGLIAPATGANNVVITAAATQGSIAGGAESVNGADQTTGWGTAATAEADNSTAPTVTVTSATGELVVDNVAGGDLISQQTATAGAGQTERWDSTGVDSNGFAIGSTEAGAASVVMSWTLNNAIDWASVGVSIKAAAAAAADTLFAQGAIWMRRLRLLGVP